MIVKLTTVLPAIVINILERECLASNRHAVLVDMAIRMLLSQHDDELLTHQFANLLQAQSVLSFHEHCFLMECVLEDETVLFERDRLIKRIKNNTRGVSLENVHLKINRTAISLEVRDENTR